MTIEEVLRNSEPNFVVYLSANEARALEEPDKIRARMERQMQEGQASIKAEDAINPAKIEDEMQRQHEHYGKLLQETEDEISSLELKLEFKKDVRTSLTKARGALESFLWPEERISINTGN